MVALKLALQQDKERIVELSEYMRMQQAALDAAHALNTAEHIRQDLARKIGEGSKQELQQKSHQGLGNVARFLPFPEVIVAEKVVEAAEQLFVQLQESGLPAGGVSRLSLRSALASEVGKVHQEVDLDNAGPNGIEPSVESASSGSGSKSGASGEESFIKFGKKGEKHGREDTRLV